MTRRLLLTAVAVVVVVVQAASAAPGHRQPVPEVDDRDINDLVNELLQKILANINEPLVPNGPLEIRVDQDHVAHIYLRLDECEITGVKSFVAHDCFFESYSTTHGNFSISIKAPKVTLNSAQYFINGSMVDHLDLEGHGPGMISVDDMDIKVEGSGRISVPSLSLVFDTATLDLEMLRWTVNLENMMPGTDLGTVFNEFFSMYGPAIFDMVENNINKSGKLLDILNNIFASQFDVQDGFNLIL